MYVIEHNDQGALGVVINRPADHDTLPGLGEWFSVADAPAVVFSGGPVEPDAVIGIGWAPAGDDEVPGDSGWASRRHGIGTVDLNRAPYELSPAPTRIRLFRGYSGWAPWQLDGELEAGAWIVLDAEVGDLFAPVTSELWRDVLRRQGGRLAWVADAPDDLSAN